MSNTFFQIDRVNAIGCFNLKFNPKIAFATKVLKNRQAIIGFPKCQCLVADCFRASPQLPFAGEHTVGISNQHDHKPPQITRQGISLDILQLIVGCVNGQVVCNAQKVILDSLKFQIIGKFVHPGSLNLWQSVQLVVTTEHGNRITDIVFLRERGFNGDIQSIFRIQRPSLFAGCYAGCRVPVLNRHKTSIRFLDY